MVQLCQEKQLVVAEEVQSTFSNGGMSNKPGCNKVGYLCLHIWQRRMREREQLKNKMLKLLIMVVGNTEIHMLVRN